MRGGASALLTIACAAGFLVGPDVARLAYQMMLIGAGSSAPVVSAQSAPADAPYVTQSPHAGLSAEQPLSALSNGLLKHSGGVVATAVADTDYAAVGHTHAGQPTTVVLGSDVTTALTTYANVTGVTIAVAANTRYLVSCLFRYDANATTTGIGLGWTGPASPTLTSGQMIAGLTAATLGGTTIAGNDTGGVTTASVATTANVATFQGVWANGANAGTVQVRVKSEVAVASAIILKAGSWCRSSVS